MVEFGSYNNRVTLSVSKMCWLEFINRPLSFLSRRASSKTEDRVGMWLLPRITLALGVVKVTSNSSMM